MSEEYRRVVISFWADPEIKRPLDRDAKLLLLYFFSSPHSNMIGVYYCPLEYAAAETGLPLEAVRRYVAGPLAKFLTYDERTEEVFVHALAKHNIGEELKVGKEGPDNRIKGVCKLVDAIHSPRLTRGFLLRYNEAYRLGKPLPLEEEAPFKSLSSPSEAIAVAVHSSTEQNNSVATLPAAGRAGKPPEAEEPEVEELDPNQLSPADRKAIGEYLVTVRKTWWAPDKKPPEGWNDRREASIYRQRRNKGESHEDLIRMVHGARYLVDKGEVDWVRDGKRITKPGDKLTGRILNNTHNGARDFGSQALDAYGRIGERRGPPAKGKAGMASIGQLAQQVQPRREPQRGAA